MILKGLELAGADTRGYSSVCARRGCITTAMEAGVPEAVLWLQSRHGSDRSSRTYINLHDPALLFRLGLRSGSERSLDPCFQEALPGH